MTAHFPTVALRRGVESIVDGPFGSNLASEHYVDEGARVVRVGNVGAMKFRDEDKAFVSLEHFRILERHAVTAGDLLVAGLGDERNAVGRACVAPRGIEPALVKADCFRLRTRDSIFVPRFVAWYLNSAVAAHQVEVESRGATRVRATPEAILRIQIPLPAIGEQRRIAEFLDDQVARIDNIIAARSKQQVLLTEEIASCVRDAVVGAHRSSRHASGLPWAPDLPSEWASARLSLIARIGTGHTPSRFRSEYWRDCHVPWLTTTDVYKFRYQQIDVIADTEVKISSLGLLNSSAVMHPAGTVALSRTSGSAGFAVIMGTDMATSQDFATWTPGPRLRSEYLLWCLRTMHRDLMGRLAMGSTHLTIYFPDLLSIRVPVPPLSDQDGAVEEIRHQVVRGRAQGAATKRSISLLNELKRSLITAAVTGQFDVSSADGSRVPT